MKTAKKKVVSYKGFKIVEYIDYNAQLPVFKIYTAEEWKLPQPVRCCEWEACSMKEAKDFIDSYETDTLVNHNNFLRYSEEEGFSIIK